MAIGDVCNREVVFVERTASLSEVAQVMREYHVGALVVVDEQAGGRVPVGMVTDRDMVIEVVAKQVAADSLRAGDIMSEPALTARVQDGIWETIQRMRVKGVRRVPVVNDENMLVGIVTVDDLLELLAGEISDLSRLIAREQVQEQRQRL